MAFGLRQPRVLVGFGVTSWLVPLFVSIPLYSPAGEPIIDVFAFKTVMILVGAATAAILFASYIPRLGGEYFAGALTAGIIWFFFNVIGDLVVLVWLLSMPVDEWLIGVGARYLVIPIHAAAIGYIAVKV